MEAYDIVNAPFRADDNTAGYTLVQVVQKCIDEQALGNSSAILIPSTLAINLLAKAKAEMVAIWRLKWLHHQTL